MKSLYTRPMPTESDQIAEALHNLYKEEGEQGLVDVVGPPMARHIRNLITIENVGPALAIEIALKLYDFV